MENTLVNLMYMIDSIKEKISDVEYLELCQELKKCNEREDEREDFYRVFYIFTRIIEDEDIDDEDNKNIFYIKPLFCIGSEILKLTTAQVNQVNGSIRQRGFSNSNVVLHQLSRYLDQYIVKDNISSHIDCLITKIDKC